MPACVMVYFAVIEHWPYFLPCMQITLYFYGILDCFTHPTGVPACPVVNISTADSSLTVTMSAGERPWLLPVWFQVLVSSGDCHTRSFSTRLNKLSISPGQPRTASWDNISVVPCNSVGCNEGCPAYLTNNTTLEGTGCSFAFLIKTEILIMQLIHRIYPRPNIALHNTL